MVTNLLTANSLKDYEHILVMHVPQILKVRSTKDDDLAIRIAGEILDARMGALQQKNQNELPSTDQQRRR
jgi:hypothetical protein